LNSRVSEIYQQIEKLNAELADIRAECKHGSYTVGCYSWSTVIMQVAGICDACGQAMGGVTPEELQRSEGGTNMVYGDTVFTGEGSGNE